MNPLTTIKSANLKDELETKNLNVFKQDINEYHTWLLDIKTQIKRDEGKGNYNEYLRSMYKTYATCNNKEFRKSIKDEYRKWITGRLKVNYDLKDLIETATLLFNNERARNNWECYQSKSNATSKSKEIFLALTATIIEIKKKVLLSENGHKNGNQNGGGNGNGNGQNQNGNNGG